MHHPYRTPVALVVGGGPLLIYPAIFLAGIMSLAAERTGGEPEILILASTAFLIGSIVYPLVYAPCLIAALRIRATESRETKAYQISKVPLYYLAVLTILAMTWKWAEQAY